MKLCTVVILVCLSAPGMASAQILGSIQAADAPPSRADAQSQAGAPDSTAPVGAQTAAPVGSPATAPVNPNIFKSVRQDFTSFFSADTAKILGVFAVAGLSAKPIDHASVEDAEERVPSTFANFGNVAGSLAVQAGGGFATYVIGRATGKPEMASLGSDLVRAQLLSQIFVQGTKFAVGRERPDGSNGLSFPSGHSASAFATATVIQQHFGWTAGIPAYTFAGFVGASRMASGKHYLTDVLVGAGIGVAAGRTVTLHIGREKFDLGAAPTQGGAMVSFTKRTQH